MEIGREMNIKLMKKLCSMDKKKLYSTLLRYLKTKGYTSIRANNMYMIAEGNLPICLLAHMDTVFSEPPKEFYYDQEQTVLWSPDGLGTDDRAGIYIILGLIEKGYKPSIIFTDLEEKGGIGADALIKKYPKCPLPACKALIQLDRQGHDDAVYYDCDNLEFEELITSYGFQTQWGTFTDISIIAPKWKVAAVNLSVGYVEEHSFRERINMTHCVETMDKVEKMLKDCESWDNYIYIPYIYPVAEIKNVKNTQKDKDEQDTWWNLNKCMYCNKFVAPDEGHVVGASWEDPENYTLLCDDCYNYFSAKEED